jgi:hypothetical protein
MTAKHLIITDNLPFLVCGPQVGLGAWVEDCGMCARGFGWKLDLQILNGITQLVV